jgi:hypothetical protein
MNVASVPKWASRSLDDRQRHNFAALGSLALELVAQSKTRDLTAFEWDVHFLKLQRFYTRTIPGEALLLIQELSALCCLCSERELRNNRDHFCFHLVFALPTLRADIQRDVRKLCRLLLSSAHANTGARNA